jgi:hypothetical protein
MLELARAELQLFGGCALVEGTGKTFEKARELAGEEFPAVARNAAYHLELRDSYDSCWCVCCYPGDVFDEEERKAQRDRLLELERKAREASPPKDP